MELARSVRGQMVGVAVGLGIGTLLFVGAFLLARSTMDAGATHDGTANVHLCASFYTGNVRVMPAYGAGCNPSNEYQIDLASGGVAADIEARLSALEVQVPDCLSDDDGTALFSGCDVQIVNGMNETETTNGSGNLIVGYNENTFDFARTGSHNLVVGMGHGYASWGGLVAGINNIVSGAFASVSGGTLNEASGDFASVSGGTTNEANGTSSSISGGYFNDATGSASSISGGENNLVTGSFASISGGQSNIASGQFSSVSGGSTNEASGEHSSVSGGQFNAASGITASVSGGNANTASGFGASISGGEDSDATGTVSSVSGGEDNRASGANSSVSGGESNTADGAWSSVSGGTGHTISLEGFGPGFEHDWIAGSLVQDF